MKMVETLAEMEREGVSLMEELGRLAEQQKALQKEMRAIGKRHRDLEEHTVPEDPGEVLERLREQHDAADVAEEFEARGKELARRLAVKQAEKDRYIRVYAQGHISDEELDAYLAELKDQIDNLRVLLASVDAELSGRRERTALTDTTHAWLVSLRRSLDEVEEDTPEAFGKQLVGLLVGSISLGRSQEGSRAEVQITYRFGPPPDSDAESYSGLSMPGFKNGRRS